MNAWSFDRKTCCPFTKNSVFRAQPKRVKSEGSSIRKVTFLFVIVRLSGCKFFLVTLYSVCDR